MTIKIEGEAQNMASYHTQYQILHETLFSHMYSINGEVKIPEENKKQQNGDVRDLFYRPFFMFHFLNPPFLLSANVLLIQEWPVFFDKTAQLIVEEFATRYGIESIFMAMT